MDSPLIRVQENRGRFTTTVTQSGEGATWSLVGENTVAAGQQTYTYTLTRTSGSRPLNEYFGFTSDTLEAERFQDGYSDCTGTNYFCFTLSNSFSYTEFTVSNVRFAGRILRDTSTHHVLTLKVATGTPTGTTVTLGVVSRSGVPRSGGLQITVATAPTNTAPTVANTIPNQTAMAGTAFSYAFLANTFADTDPGDTLTYTATQSDDTALPSWLSFAAATRTFSGTPTAADVGTVSVKVTASDGHGGSVSDTFDIVVSAAAGVTVSTSALTVTEEDTTGNTYTVVLDSQPTANVTVTVAGHAGTDVTPSPTSLTFTTTTWGTAQTVTVTAGDDADTANDTVTLTHSAASTDSNYGGITIGSVVVTVADNDSLTAPGAPTGLAATANGPSQIDLAWTAPATTGGSAITGYKIEVSPDGSSWSDLVADTASTDTAYAHVGLDPATTRHYRVSAINANGTGVPSNVDSATTGTTVPGAPTGLTATASGTTAINLSWSAPASTGGSAITGYKIEVSPNGTSGWTDQVANTNSTATTYAHTGLAAGDTRHYRVSAINANGTGVPSNVDSATTASTNTAAMGAPTITGTAQVGQTLTAATTGITDADGLTSPTYTYQWIRVDGTDEADIAAANSSTYILGAADLGTTLKVRVTFADDLGHTETLTSAATATVGAGAVATAPTVTDVAVTSTPASGTTYYLAGEVIEFTVTFSAPVTVTATPKFAFRLGAATRQAAYARGSDSAALVFARTVQAGEVDSNGISWNAIALALDGGTITQTGATTAARLTHAAQASLEGHRVDAAPPMQVSASVQGLSLVLVYDEPLDPASMPATGAYTVTATGGATTTTPAVSEVSIYGIWVTLTLDAAPAAGATVTLAYAPPASNPVQDEAGNDAPAFSGQKVNGAAGNTPATGAPTITGTAQVGQTLTAGTTAIMDADGLTSVSYTYQWIRVATDNTETNISSATASTYTLVAADQGTTVKVTVSFTDDANNPETRTSAATATVSAAANTLATGAPTITGTAQVGQTLTAGTTAIMDADGLTSVSYTYQWIRVDGTDEEDISGENSSTYTLVDADLGTTLKVKVSFTDDASNSETLTSAATATVSAAPNTLATGAPTITGTAQVGQTLTAATTGITDADGLTSPTYTYQWIRVDGTDEEDISGENSSTYTLGDADLGTTLKVRVTFADDLGHTETLTSAATATVTATPAVPTREPFPEPEPEPEPEPVPALPLLGQLLLALGLAGAGAMRLVRAARRP